ncbi:OmpW/AlkL family protein [Thiolinea disciformis]|uniref:OmpW/AlkL family protein n=1 Tax=Thiolinea disciformis TaxID=125614 RepID=UPI0003706E0F|nr:OmpW family outer membrane protein [Thiolinea disciformis]
MMRKMASLSLMVLGILSANAVLAGGVATGNNSIIVRGGAAMVDPHGDGLKVGAAQLDVEDNTQLGLSASIPVAGNVAVGILAATPFKHDITLAGQKIGTTKHLPPTVTLQYHFNNGSAVKPYVGIGANYTKFFDEDSKLGSLNLDDSTGLAGELGVDYNFNKNWGVNGAVWYADIKTDATLGGAKLGEVDISPWVYMVGVSYKF